MWFKYLFLIVIFYFLAVLQSSFLSYFNILGSVPNLIFVLFFLLIFFDKNKNLFDNLLLAIFAGFFLDIFNTSFLGISVILLVLIYFIIAKLLNSLKSSTDQYPLAYFVPIFIISLLIYQTGNKNLNFSWVFVADVFYNLIFALIGYFIFRKFLGKDTRQLSLNI